MATKKKLLQAAAGNAGGAGLDVDEVFSTYLYTGTGSTLNIVNGIDLAGEGGLVWHKYRGGTSDHGLFDTERGVSRKLGSNNTGAQTAAFSGYGITAFNSNGYTLGTQYSGENGNGNEVVSWSFLKSKRFFDIQTWTGNSTAGRTISHNLEAEIGFIAIKCTSVSGDWMSWHRSASSYAGRVLKLNATDAAANISSIFNSTNPTSTEFTLGSSYDVNGNGQTYVAYIFAHNDGDGEFGPDSDQDIIKCGSYTGNGSTDGPDIDLGFEPQWVMLKNSSTGNSFTTWNMYDNMRGVATGGNDARLFANVSEQEYSNLDTLRFNANGFSVEGSTSGQVNASGDNYVYIAIRRGPLAPPESATDVFDMSYGQGTKPWFQTSGWPVDMAIEKPPTSGNGSISSRFMPEKFLYTNGMQGEMSGSNFDFDFQSGFYDLAVSSTSYIGYMWRRAPSFFDVVAWNGSSASTRVLNHNLGVAPQMIWAKNRNDTDSWVCYHEATGNTGYIPLNLTSGFLPYAGAWSNTTPSATTFKVGNSLNWSSSFNYIAFLFSTLDGISKVGSYTGNGSSQTIDCGFSAGSRYILIKRTSPSGNWYYWSSLRGIISRNSPHQSLNTNSAPVTTDDSVDPASSGFIVNQVTATNINVSGATYIFYAIA